MDKITVESVREAGLRINNFFGGGQRHSAAEVKKFLEERDRKKPEWLRERLKELDEAYARKKDEGWLPWLVGAGIALGGLKCLHDHENDARKDPKNAPYQAGGSSNRAIKKAWSGIKDKAGDAVDGIKRKFDKPADAPSDSTDTEDSEY